MPKKLGRKWFTRRKMLTPTFHFKILEDFVQVFNEQSQILIQQLQEALKEKNELDIYPFIARCTLDIICGTFHSSYFLKCNSTLFWCHNPCRHSDGMQHRSPSPKRQRIRQSRLHVIIFFIILLSESLCSPVDFFIMY